MKVHSKHYRNVDKSLSVVKIGSHNLYQFDAPYQIDMKIAGSYLHPKYVDSPNPGSDIALIKLESSIPYPFNERINVVCLPVANSWPEAGVDSVIAGWGRTAGNNSSS